MIALALGIFVVQLYVCAVRVIFGHTCLNLSTFLHFLGQTFGVKLTFIFGYTDLCIWCAIHVLDIYLGPSEYPFAWGIFMVQIFICFCFLVGHTSIPDD